MRNFHCDHCRNLVFFENVRCLSCDHVLAFLPDEMDVRSLEPSGDGRWRISVAADSRTEYRLCRNYSEHNVCNWAIRAEDPNPLCSSCRLTRIVPALATGDDRRAWYLLEQAKRRLIYSILELKLPLVSKRDDPDRGLAFEFLADASPQHPEAKPVMTGHAHGVITINLAEADDAERERRRMAFHEPYRTLLGHFRHESGHYYWDRLIRDEACLSEFRRLFGDERQDYAQALSTHYQQGPHPDWQSQFISAYAGSHPWEDWAETWSHYLHMFDTLETARESGLALLPRRRDLPLVHPDHAGLKTRHPSFEVMLEYWYGVTYLLNNLNRGLGQKDGYPFVLSTPVIEKLRFIHDLCQASRMTTGSSSSFAGQRQSA